jgi:hypothetical protein
MGAPEYGVPRPVISLSPEQMVSLAQMIVETIGKAFPASGLRMVLVVTDQEGEHVGVGMTTGLEDALALLRCALAREGAIDHGGMPEVKR